MTDIIDGIADGIAERIASLPADSIEQVPAPSRRRQS